MTPELTFAILSFIVFAIPIVGALWRIFSVREKLQAQLTALGHRIDLLETNEKHATDHQLLAFNGLKELIEHVRTRTANQAEQLSDRVNDIECFLEKTTNFNRRKH